MKKIFDVAVLGAGASGIMSAIFACQNNCTVALIEKDNTIGKKLLVTGNGRCNLANNNYETKFYNNEKVEQIFKQFSVNDLLSFFKQIGIETFADEQGRIYPISESANSVVDALTKKIESMPITVLTNSKIKACQKVGELFETVLENDEIIYSKNIIIATGGTTVKQILKNAQLDFAEEKKVLVGFTCDNYSKTLSGLRVNAQLTLNCHNKTFCELGQVQFRDDGISGIVVFNASAFIAMYGVLPVEINLNFLPRYDENKILQILKQRQKDCSYLKVKDFLVSLFHFKLCANILKKANIHDLENNCTILSEKQLTDICHVIQNYKLKLTATSGVPQVDIGGVEFDKLKNLQTSINGLYVCGESAGVFGYCGGYNLMWAFCSGVVCGKQIQK